MDDAVRTYGYLALGTRLKRLGERLQAETQRMIDRTDSMTIPASQFPYLATIDMLGPLSVGALAEALGVTQPGVTRTVLQLAEAGLIVTEPAPDDQRSKIVRLSDAGRQRIEIAKAEEWPRILAAVEDLCGALGGPLLDQLAAIEDGLAAESLEKRSLRLLQEEVRK